MPSSSNCSGTVAEPHCFTCVPVSLAMASSSAQKPPLPAIGASTLSRVHNELADELESFATLTGGCGLGFDKFWTYERRGYILNLPSIKAKQVSHLIKSQFAGLLRRVPRRFGGALLFSRRLIDRRRLIEHGGRGELLFSTRLS